VGTDLAIRVEEAIVTGASPFARVTLPTVLVALMLVGLLWALGLRAEAPASDRRVIEAGLAAIAILVAVDLLAGGLGFVPGLAATTPVAVLGATRAWSFGDRRFVAVVALGSLPLVWAVQFTGGAGPQWGGRYILTSGALLVVLATVTFTSDSARSVLRTTALAGFAMTIVGVAWTIHRTHEFADAFDELAETHVPVLVFHDPFLAREGGTLLITEQWLAATGPRARTEAVEVLEKLGVSEAGFVDLDDGTPVRELPGWVETGSERVQLLDGIHLRVTYWRGPEG
jgi:hypothetical protein